MTNQLQEAKDWLGDLSKIVSRQKTKEDYEYAKKRTEALGYLINRVEEFEKEIEGRKKFERNRVQQVNNLMERNQRYKQALENIEELWANREFNDNLAWDMLLESRQALKGESQ